MCGIVGASGSLSQKSLDAMIKAMCHRGPDSQGSYSANSISLGHVRLSIVDISSASNQPLWDSNGRVCIVFNGEIYNYQELRDDLIARDHVFRSRGDAEVIVNLYLEFGLKFLDHLEGMYSFAIWDSLNETTLLARDGFGVKPLYYTTTDQGFYFSSEIKSLIEVNFGDRTLNYDALLRTLIFLWSPGEDTLLENVKKLMPGHYMIVKDGHIIDQKRFWSWPSYAPTNMGVSKLVDKLRSALDTSVKEQMTSDVPVGAFLSGGLDSSLIVAIAKKQTKRSLPCFTINSGQSSGENVDDLPFAKKVAEFLNESLSISQVSPDIVKELETMIWHLDELQADPAALNVRFICHEAKKQGIKVLLSGAGGDDLFSGYRRHDAVRLECYWAWLPWPMRRLLSYIADLVPQRKDAVRRAAKAFQYAHLDSSSRLLSYFYWMEPNEARDLFVDEIKSKIAPYPMAFLKDEIDELGAIDPLEKMLYLERKYFLVDHNFNYTDKMSMSQGVEVRVPFMSRQLAKIASTIPVNLKHRFGVGKWILKKVAEGLLPNDVIYRPKTGFGVPLRSWIKGELAEYIDQQLAEEKIKARGIFKPEKVRSMIEDNHHSVKDYSYPIFCILCFEIWCQMFLDERGGG